MTGIFPDLELYPEMIQPREGWKYLGTGGTRECYLLPSGNVLKIPRCLAGADGNHKEALLWKKRHAPEEIDGWYDGWSFARCRIIPGTDLLVMEYVEPYQSRGLLSYDLPKWCTRVDCAQVGFNRAGQLVAYDYAE